MAINKKLITFDKKLTFLGANGINNLSSPVNGYYNLIPTWSMVFIKDTGEIWHDGVYFGKPIKDQIFPIMQGTTKGLVFTPNGTDYYYKTFNLWGNTFDGDTININGDLVVQGVTYKWTYGDASIKKGNTNLIAFSNNANNYDVFIPNGNLNVTGGDIDINNNKIKLSSTGSIKGTHILNTNSYFNADNTLGKTWNSIKLFNTSGTTISLDTTRPAIINILEHAHASNTLWVPWIAGGDITAQSSWGIGLGGDAFYIGRIAKAHTENSLSQYWKFDSEDGITISGTTKYIKVANLSDASSKIFMADGSVKSISSLVGIGEATTSDYGGFKLSLNKASSQQTMTASTTGSGRYAVKMNADGTLYVEFSQANTWKAANTSQEGYVPKLALSTTNTITTQGTEYVLTYKSGSETVPSWRKLPANAYKNDNTLYYLTLNGVVKGHSGKTNLGTFYAVATSDASEADQVWMRNSDNTNYAWRTLGSRAFDSTDYLPLTGGTLSGTKEILKIAATSGTYGCIYWTLKDYDTWTTGINSSNYFYFWNSNANAIVGYFTREGELYVKKNKLVYHSGNLTTFVKSGSTAAAGLVPKPSTTAGTNKFLCEDGTWKTPSYTSDTNTWREIKVNGTQKRSTAITSGDLDFINGSNTTVEWTSENKLKINSTWTAWKGATSDANGTAGYMPAPTSALRNLFLRGDGSWVSLNNYSLPKATTSALGGIIVSNVLTTAVTLTSANGSTANRYYGVQLDKDGKAFVNIPWVWNAFTAATADAAGTAGYIQAPKGALSKFFRGDNTWQSITSNVTTSLYFGTSNGTANAEVATTPYIILKEGSSYTRYKLEGAGGITVSSDANGNVKFTGTTYSVFTGATADAAGSIGLVKLPSTGDLTKFLRGDCTWQPLTSNVTTALYVGASNGTSTSAQSTNGNVYLILKEGSSYTRYNIVGSGRASVKSDANGKITINSSGYSNFTAATADAAGEAGLVPGPAKNILGSSGYFLRADGIWAVPTNTWKEVSTSQEGYVPKIVTTGSLTSSDNPFILVYKNVSGTTKSVWVPLPANAFNNTWTAADFTNAGYVPKSVKGKFLHAKSDTGALEWVDDNNTWKAASTSQEGYVPKLITGGGTIASSDTAYVLAYKSGVAGTTAPVWILLPSNAYNNTWTANAVGVAGYVAAPTKAANANMTWSTDANGNPAWRASNNHSHSYLPLSGGTMTGNITFDTGTTTEKVICFNVNRNSSSFNGGWATSSLTWRDASNSTFFQLGVYGASNTFNYTYIGTGGYNSTTNFRIYSNAIKFGNDLIAHAGNITNEAAVIGTTATTLATIAGVNITASLPIATRGESAVTSGVITPTSSGTTKFLCEDGTWKTPSYTTNTDNTGVKQGSDVTGLTKKNDSTVIKAASASGLSFIGGVLKFYIADTSNYIEIPVSHDTISTTTIAAETDSNATNLSFGSYFTTLTSATISNGHTESLTYTKFRIPIITDILERPTENNTTTYRIVTSSGSSLYREDDFFLYRNANKNYLNLSKSGITGGITFHTVGETSGTYGDLQAAACTAYRSWTLPNDTGTIALTKNVLALSGGTMKGTAWIMWEDSGNWSKEPKNDGVIFPVIRGGIHWKGQSDYVKLYSEETGNDNLDLVLQFGDDNSNCLSIRDKDSQLTAYIKANGSASFSALNVNNDLTVGSLVKNGAANDDILLGNGSTIKTTELSYVKLDAGTTEQTIKNSISSLTNGSIEIWRATSGGFPMIGFANGTTKTKLGMLGFSEANTPVFRDTSSVSHTLYHSGNIPSNNKNTAGIVAGPGAAGKVYISNSSGVPTWDTYDTTVTLSSGHLITSGAVYTAIANNVAGAVQYLGTIASESDMIALTSAGLGDFARVITAFTFTDARGSSVTAHVGDVVYLTNNTPGTSSNWIVAHTEIDTNTWTAASTSAAGYIPKLITGGSALAASTTDYVLSYVNGATTPSWNKLPANAYKNDNTWRNVYFAGTEKVGTGTGTKAVNYVAGSNVSITYEAAGKSSGQSGNANYFNVKIAATNTWIAMTGATSSANGTTGYINATPPKDGYNTKYWRADGTWATPSLYYLTLNGTVKGTSSTTNLGTFYAVATSDTTTANQVWMRNSANNGYGWRTLGSNAFDSTAYLPLSAGSGKALTDNLYFNSTGKGIWFKDSAGNQYAAIYENGTNLWIGSSATNNSTHHTGSTYISAGTGYVYVSRLVDNTRTNYKVLDAGNTYVSSGKGYINSTEITTITGNAGTATYAKWLMNKGSTTSGSEIVVGDSGWSIGKTLSGYTNLDVVWSLSWKKNGQTYTPSGGSATNSTDGGNIVMWVSKSNTSNAQSINIQIDGLFYAAGGLHGNLTGNVTGNADTATHVVYTGLTGSGTIANLAIVSTGTANGWLLKTLGSNAFTSTTYATPDATTTLQRAASNLTKDTWSDVGTFGDSVTAGTYVVNFTYDNIVYSGVFSYSASNDTLAEEINLHAAGTGTKRLYARISGKKFLIVTADTTFSMAKTVFNFRKLI